MESMTQSSYVISPTEVCIVDRDDDDLGYLWFADRCQGEVRYFGLTRSYEDGTLHSERDDQKWQAVGGLVGVEFDGSTLAIHFDKVAAASLGGIDTAVIDCRAIQPTDRARIEHSLGTLLAGTNVPIQIRRA